MSESVIHAQIGGSNLLRSLSLPERFVYTLRVVIHLIHSRVTIKHNLSFLLLLPNTEAPVP